MNTCAAISLTRVCPVYSLQVQNYMTTENTAINAKHGF